MSRVCPNRVGGVLKEPSEAAALTRRNPARLAEVVTRFPEATPEDVDAAIAAARNAQPAWGAASGLARSAVLLEAAGWLAERRDGLAEEITAEEGKTLAESRGEVETAVATLRYLAGLAVQPIGRTLPSRRTGTVVWTTREALGVVAVLTPWNFPVAIPCAKIGAALAAGNAVVFKPSPYTPLAGWRVVEAFLAAGVPDGILNFLTDGGGRVGRSLVGDGRVDGISFTGSTRVGRTIAETAACRLVPCQLELGGKNALVVLSDADLDLAADLAVSGAFSGTGQKCTATSRLIVVRDVAAALLDRLAARVERIRVGSGLDPDTTMGPVVTEERLGRLLASVADAERDGARCLLGGRRLTGPRYQDGLFMKPTVLVGVQPGSSAAEEELFGPVLAVLEVRDDDEALRCADSSTFGLSSAVCTNDPKRALRVAGGMQTGLVNINKGTLSMEYQVPASGWRESGFGAAEFGPSALDFYSAVKTVYWSHGAWT